MRRIVCTTQWIIHPGAAPPPSFNFRRILFYSNLKASEELAQKRFKSWLNLEIVLNNLAIIPKENSALRGRSISDLHATNFQLEMFIFTSHRMTIIDEIGMQRSISWNRSICATYFSAISQLIYNLFLHHKRVSLKNIFLDSVILCCQIEVRSPPSLRDLKSHPRTSRSLSQPFVAPFNNHSLSIQIQFCKPDQAFKEGLVPLGICLIPFQQSATDGVLHAVSPDRHQGPAAPVAASDSPKLSETVRRTGGLH